MARLIHEPHPPRYALRASLRLSKFVPDEFFEPGGFVHAPSSNSYEKSPAWGLFS